MAASPILGYWKLRGLGQSIRLILEYTQEDYEEKFYHFGPAPDYDKPEWLSVKYNLGLTFPNLPYYIDGDTKITQSHAILRYIARKHNLCGTNEKEKILVDTLEHQAMDFRMSYVRLVYMNYNTEKQKYLENLPTTLKAFSDCLGEDDWFAGSKITFPDFLLYELFDIHRILFSSCLDNFPRLKRFMTDFEQLPEIKTYKSSPNYMVAPLNGPMALVGGK